MKVEGKIKSNYPVLNKDGNLAELIGVVLGDGHIWKYDRTEELSIFSNANNLGFVKRYAYLIETVFHKKPTISNHSGVNCKRIRIYEKHIQRRLGVPYSPRLYKKIVVQKWISNKNSYVIRYLRGLYEAEGSHSIHFPTSTYKVQFSNKNVSMLENVFKLIKRLGFHPHWTKSNYSIQLSKKDEVFDFLKLIEFRRY